MRREQKFILAFAVVVLVPVGIIWFVVWPLLHPWHLPVVVAGEMQEPGERVLTEAEARDANRWLQAHETGWGLSGERPPVTGTPPQEVRPAVRLTLATEDHKPILVSVWRSAKGADVIGIQTTPNGPYRMHSFTEDEVKPLLPEDVRS